MSLVLDVLIHEIGSQSNPGLKYQVRLRRDDAGHCWLSCGCPSWTKGPYQAGKPVHLRYCKHTDRTIIEKPFELSRHGYIVNTFIPNNLPALPALEEIKKLSKPKKFEPVKTGLSRKVRK